MRCPISRWFLTLVILFAGCKSVEQAEASDPAGISDRGPNVNELVSDGQNTWLQELASGDSGRQLDRLVVFGDSLSDAGNLNRRTLGVMVPPQIYWKSRWTNGPNWTDYVGTALGVTVENHAYGGAQTRTLSLRDRIAVPSSQQQIDDFLGRQKRPDPDKTLYVLWIGPNNYFNADNDKVEEVVGDIAAQVKKLHAAGIRHLLVGDLLEMAYLPANPHAPALRTDEQYHDITVRHNNLLGETIGRLATELAGLQLISFHAYDINQRTIDRPADFGFIDLAHPCYDGSASGKFYGEKRFCPDYFKWKFWDYVHPNSKMHCYYASRMLADLAGASLIAPFNLEQGIERCRALKEKASAGLVD